MFTRPGPPSSQRRPPKTSVLTPGRGWSGGGSLLGYAHVVSPGHRPPVYSLNFHADFACGRSGACCSAGWDIPVEADVARNIEAALEAGRLRKASGATLDVAALVRTPPPPDGASAVLGKDRCGTCVFLDGRRVRDCLVHRDLGHEALPSACRQFPRISLLDARGTHVTLSHFCPTAAALLLRSDVGAPEIVANAPRTTARASYEGFDATGTIPPLVRPGVAFDEGSYTRWEAWQIAVLGLDDLGADRALRVIAFAAETLRSWTPAQGPLLDTIEQVTEASLVAAREEAGGAARPPLPGWGSAAARSYERVAQLVGPGLNAPGVPPNLDTVAERFVERAWSGLSRAVGRFLAAKAFAAWSAYLGEGVRTNLAVLALARDVLKVECVRQAGYARRPLDASLFVEAARQSDLLLEHLVDRAALVRVVGDVERAPL